MNRNLHFHSVVFAGGGNRCVWQGGFWHRVAQELSTPPKVVVGCSAGSSISAIALAGKGEAAYFRFLDICRGIDKNFDWRQILKGERPFPHVKTYRNFVTEMVDGPALEKLRRGPELRILMAKPPAWAGPRLAVFLGLSAYSLEKHINQPLHPVWAGKLGFKPVIGIANQCRDVTELADLILASSCTPPIVPVMKWQGQTVLDGGVIDNVPVAALQPGEEPALVLLSRRLPPDRLRNAPAGRTYLMPSAPPQVGKWDYTNPEGVRQCWEMGLADGERFLKEGPAALQR